MSNSFETYWATREAQYVVLLIICQFLLFIHIKNTGCYSEFEVFRVASGGDGIPAISNSKRRCCESAAYNMWAVWKIKQWPQDWKRSVFIPIPKKGNAKECSNYCTIALISHTSKVMLKILQARLQQYENHELPDVQAGFRKGKGTREQVANIHWIIKK